MSHINYSAVYEEQRKNQKACYKKHTDDAAASPLISYMTKVGIDFVQDIADGITADGHNTSSLAIIGQSEKATKDRNNAFAPVWRRTLMWIQFLKPLFKENMKEFTEWSVDVDVNGKILFATTFAKKVVVTKAMIAKHGAYAAGTSPLQPFITTNKDDLVKLLGKTTDADAFEISRDDLKAKAEVETGKRNTVWAKPYSNQKDIGTYLVGLYPEDKKTVALWGYDVVDAVPAAKEKTITVKPLVRRAVSGIVKGTVLKNTGKKDFNVYKGRKGLGDGTLLKVGEEMGMNKGCSAIVVFNPTDIGDIMFSVTTK